MGEIKRAEHLDPVAFLRIVGIAGKRKVRARKDLRGDLDDFVAVFTRVNLPLEGVVSDR